MQISLRSLMLLGVAVGALPFWYDNLLVPFFIIMIVCVGMSLRAFATEFRDD
jgi:hypothetical protein